MSTGDDALTKRYFRELSRGGSIIILILFLPELPVLILQDNPILALILSGVISLALIVIAAVMRYRIDLKYKQVSASRRDYIRSYLGFLFIGLVAPIIVSVFDLAPSFGYLTIVYIDLALLLLFVFLAFFPRAFMLGRRATPITDETILDSFQALAAKMGVHNVRLFSIDWKNFKIANAFQTGPSRFSVFISNYLLETLTPEETNAVMAHELAHAKMRHVAKNAVLSIGMSLIGINILLVVVVAPEISITMTVALLAAAFLCVFGMMPILMRLRRRYEYAADEIAVKTLGNAAPVVSMLVKLTQLNLMPTNPKRNWGGTHPTLTKRIERIERTQSQMNLN